MISSHTLDKPILMSLLRSFLPFIHENQEWTKFTTLLGKVQKLSLIIQNRPIKQKQKCPLCQFVYQSNIFLLLIHLQVVHQNNQEEQFKVKKYQLFYEGLQIHIVKKSPLDHKKQKISSNQIQNSSTSQIKKDYFQYTYISDTNNSYQSSGCLMSNLKTRNIELLTKLFSKFTKRIQNISAQRKYYHSYNVFRPIMSPQSDQQNSQDEQCTVQKQLQKLRINDLIDVGEYDKKLFLSWNQLMRQTKKIQFYLQQNTIMETLKTFSQICKKQKIPRINLIMHLWTLWSVGKINSVNIIQILQVYDDVQIE